MVHSILTTPNCSACAKPVYYNDLQVRAKTEHLYHKACFKCTECASQLTLNSFAYHGDTLLCKIHYVSFFQRMNSYGGEDKFKKQKDDVVSAAVVQEISSMAKQPPIKHYEPEPETELPIDGRPRKISSITDSFSANPFLLHDMRLRRRNSGEDDGDDAMSIRKGTPIVFKVKSSPKCANCCTSVYLHDPKMALEGKVFHHSCFKCASCATQLTLKNFTYASETLLCKGHYTERFIMANSYAGGEQFAKK
ncbi:hypothetical protein SDRG_04149 [Saprolegnia diclina VS20]|uniref:LIM zinc-binding domain-containing protein n=1 Tax=Saprolegnia diclina (strain VS20) TaxID=1156394 RepID=T0QWQ2_SAPDV|nr:hypothetical protein SDRG_04149 [Saprolegnia diclina VS20]EQC38440.1 hypothetical protein SDRG_04149 [Saprolegnia diclina VS20]|eukprot:XP_008608032.1 hypothetical protein SDRG_04149 [Saprolegnia diclina VS20]